MAGTFLLLYYISINTFYVFSAVHKNSLGTEFPPAVSRGSAFRSVCEAACLIESSCAAPVRFCVCVEGPQRRADADLSIPLAHKQVGPKKADLCPPLSPFERGSARWRRSINTPKRVGDTKGRADLREHLRVNSRDKLPRMFWENEPSPAASQSRWILLVED